MPRLKVITLFIVMLLGALDSVAQKFSVESFRLLPNDVTAFIDPVEDLNGDRCALLKVEATPDFVFSTPLGIVRRVDKTGEIWLYLPKGSKMITIKHPQWGVMRDYRFPSKLVDQQSYELRIACPEKPVLPDSTLFAPVAVRDTLLIVRTDTLMVEKPKVRVPFSADVIATLGSGSNSGLIGGVMVTAMKRFGGFIHLSSDFGRVGKTSRICGKDGEINGVIPYYSGKTRHSFIMVNAGVAERLSRKVSLFQGVGYGDMTTVWELAPSEGGGYVKNSRYSHKGVAFEAGTVIALGRIAVSASVSSIKGTQWFGNIGIGIRIGKRGKKITGK